MDFHQHNVADREAAARIVLGLLQIKLLEQLLQHPVHVADFRKCAGIDGFIVLELWLSALSAQCIVGEKETFAVRRFGGHLEDGIAVLRASEEGEQPGLCLGDFGFGSSFFWIVHMDFPF